MKTDEQILAELGVASAGLLFMSESEYPFEVVRVEEAGEPAGALRRLSGAASDEPVVTQSVEDFFRVAASEAEWRTPAERVEAKRYQALIALLRENLKEVMAYRVGSINIQVFLIGLSASGSWLGLSTRVVET
ncbi:MAG: nuclease A inhibitor family protein [Acidobacteria bacterium]|nr:nuclease A inhibitor family protein [Acidobacteriota bacterium]